MIDFGFCSGQGGDYVGLEEGGAEFRLRWRIREELG